MVFFNRTTGVPAGLTAGYAKVRARLGGERHWDDDR
jgi:hypothetical protein